MATIKETVRNISAAPTFDARVAEMRKIPGRHGTDDWQEIFAQVAREVYVPALTPDFAYIHSDDSFYSESHFREAYRLAADATNEFSNTTEATIAATLEDSPLSLLAFRVITGLTREEFAHAVSIACPDVKMSGASIDGHERSGKAMKPERATQLARTISRLVLGNLFGSPPSPNVQTKQAFKSDTRSGWDSVHSYAVHGVPYSSLLHQRHYGGAFRQLLDATSTKRGNIIEDAVEELFSSNKVPYIRTGAHNQGDIAKRFGLEVRPAPDFVVFDEKSDTLMAILECKGANDGGTARDKALRFNKLRAESQRLNGIPVIAVLGGIGWRRVNDTLGPVLQDTEGRVFTLSTLPEMLTVSPLITLVGTAP